MKTGCLTTLSRYVVETQWLSSLPEFYKSRERAKMRVENGLKEPERVHSGRESCQLDERESCQLKEIDHPDHRSRQIDGALQRRQNTGVKARSYASCCRIWARARKILRNRCS